MVSKKEIELHNKIAELRVFIESLYYPGANSKDFEAVRQRFFQLFLSNVTDSIEKKGEGQ